MEDLKSKVIEYSIKYGHAIEEGKKSADKFHSKLMSLYEKTEKSRIWDVLKELLMHGDEPVRLWASVFLLPHDEELALKELKKLERSEKIHSVTATALIDLWSKGMLDL